MWAVNIRKFVLTAARLGELVELGTLTPQASAFLEASVRVGLNILVPGGRPRRETPLVANTPSRTHSHADVTMIDPYSSALPRMALA
jgi:hypothetical protein